MSMPISIASYSEFWCPWKIKKLSIEIQTICCVCFSFFYKRPTHESWWFFFDNNKENPQPLPFGRAQDKPPLLCNSSQTMQERYPALDKPSATSSTQKANPLLSLARGFELMTSNMEVLSPNHGNFEKKNHIESSKQQDFWKSILTFNKIIFWDWIATELVINKLSFYKNI